LSGKMPSTVLVTDVDIEISDVCLPVLVIPRQYDKQNKNTAAVLTTCHCHKTITERVKTILCHYNTLMAFLGSTSSCNSILPESMYRLSPAIPCGNDYSSLTNIGMKHREWERRISRTYIIGRTIPHTVYTRRLVWSILASACYTIVLEAVPSRRVTLSDNDVTMATNNDSANTMLMKMIREFPTVEVWMLFQGLHNTLQNVETIISALCCTVLILLLGASIRSSIWTEFLSAFQFWMTYLIGRNLGSEYYSFLYNIGKDPIGERRIVWTNLVRPCLLFVLSLV
jgi:hypothetical protein